MQLEDPKSINKRGKLKGKVDQEGRLVLPPDVLQRYGLKPSAQVHIDEGIDGLRLRLPVTHLAKVYVEPTNACNLRCRTCIRNNWDSPVGQMSLETFARMIEGLKSFSPPPTVFFGGFGEPLSHPYIVEMITQAKALGGPVELVTNGTMLNREMSRRLVESGLDMLWISLDGATPESYNDLRLGAALPDVLANLIAFREVRWGLGRATPDLGVVFVAMKQNIADLPQVLQLRGVSRFLVTNVLPYTPEMSEEVLYVGAVMSNIFRTPMPYANLDLPKMDLSETTRETLYRALRNGQNMSLAGVHLNGRMDRCPFIKCGSTAISWEGHLSPCLPLLRDYRSFLNKQERFSQHYTVGSVSELDLLDLWNEPGYLAFRERVQSFEFAHCAACGGCELAEKNEEDCFGNPFPTCGGCLWAQGVIQCP
jgi:MoaA/NifB/PqqE/SkfB family radical SAM enzyme